MRSSRLVRSCLAVAVTAAAVAFSACGGTEFPSGLREAKGPTTLGPNVFDPADPSRRNTHWHAALGVYDCNHWMGDRTGSGVWSWPVATAQGSPGRAADPQRYAGLHSHDDGVIHMEPLVPEEAGRNATLGRYFDDGGWSVSSGGFEFLGRTRTAGDACAGRPGALQWEVARWDGTGGPQRFTVESGDPASYKLLDADIVVVAFLPRGGSIAAIGSPPSIVNLARAFGVQIPPPVGA